MLAMRIIGTIILVLSLVVSCFKNRFLFEDEFKVGYICSCIWGAIWRGTIIAFLWVL